MTNKVSQNRPGATGAAVDVEKLYLELLKWLYDKEDRDRAEQVAGQLDAALADRPDVAESIRGEEIHSLLAELRGDLAEAARSRESEIRKILELHSLARETPSWEFVFRKYDYTDVSDRLDLLAMLYAEQGDLDRAIRTLQESKQFCESHGIPFDGRDLLAEVEQSRRNGKVEKPLSAAASARLDKAIRAAYLDFDTTADRILVDDIKSRDFVNRVNEQLSGQVITSALTIKKRLLNLRQRGADNGGLRRLRQKQTRNKSE